MKPVRFSIAALVRRSDECFLAVRRPPDDDHLPDVWGLPAISPRPGELPEAALHRLGREKLGVDLEPLRMVGVLSADRGAYELILMEMEARIVSGTPDVTAATTHATRYVAQAWADDPEILRVAAERGSLCSRIALEDLGGAERSERDG